MKKGSDHLKKKATNISLCGLSKLTWSETLCCFFFLNIFFLASKDPYYLIILLVSNTKPYISVSLALSSVSIAENATCSLYCCSLSYTCTVFFCVCVCFPNQKLFFFIMSKCVCMYLSLPYRFCKCSKEKCIADYQLNVCMYVCMYLCMYVSMYVCMYVCVCVLKLTVGFEEGKIVSPLSQTDNTVQTKWACVRHYALFLLFH